MKKSALLIRTLILATWVGIISILVSIITIDRSPELKQESLNVYSWPELFPSKVVEKFEEETGIKVNVHTYATNEDMLFTMKTKKSNGYDIVSPSDYAVTLLIQEGLIKPLNRDRIDFFDAINPMLLGHNYDPDNRFSIPFQWEIFGFGIDRDYFEKHQIDPSWETLFSPVDLNLRVGMVSDAVEAVSLASEHLFNSSSNLSNEQKERVKSLLKNQRKWVEAYCSGPIANYLLSTRNCQLAVCTSSYVLRSTHKQPHLQFVIPGGQKFISIENVCISKSSKKDDMIYKFLNFIYKPENLGSIVNDFFTFPATTNSKPYIRAFPDYEELLEREVSKKEIHFVQHVIPENEIRKTWVDVKSTPW